MDGVLRQVFSLNDLKSNALCARVCRQWSEHALDALWEDLDPKFGKGGLVNLLSTLMELRSEQNEDKTTRWVRHLFCGSTHQPK